MSTSFLLVFPPQEGKLTFIEYLLCARTFHTHISLQRRLVMVLPPHTHTVRQTSGELLGLLSLGVAPWARHVLRLFPPRFCTHFSCLPLPGLLKCCWSFKVPQKPHSTFPDNTPMTNAVVLWSACLYELIWTCTMTICWVYLCLPQGSSGSLHVPQHREQESWLRSGQSPAGWFKPMRCHF